MKQLLISAVAALSVLPGVALSQNTRVLAGFGQTVSFTNNGVIINPQIDAINVVNHGTFLAGTFQPFETYSTRNFTNTGTMQGSIGFRFNNSSPTTPSRILSDNFVNFNPGVVQVFDSVYSGYPPASFPPCFVSPASPSYLWIFATNIITGAGAPGFGSSLRVGANGELRLVGTNVNLARSGLEVLPVWSLLEPHGEVFLIVNNAPVSFMSDLALYDRYWAQAAFTQQTPLNSGALWTGIQASAPTIGGVAGFSITPNLADSFISVTDLQQITFTNFNGSPTNVTDIFSVTIQAASEISKGAVFVATPPGVGITHGFAPAANNLATVDVVLSFPFTNVVTDQPEFAELFLSDTLGPGDRGIIPNVIGCPTNGNSRPVNYTVNWLPLITGLPGNNGVPEPDFFVSGGAGDLNTSFDGLTNALDAIVTEGDYAAYSPFIDNVMSRPPAIPAGTFTNLPGRVRIFAENLDLTRTRIRGEGEIQITASHLVSTTNAVIDVENLRFNIATTNGNLRVQNLAKESVARLRGEVYLWSATWANTVTVIFTNNFAFTNVPIIDPNDPEGTNIIGTNVLAILDPITNSVDVAYQVTMIDASRVQLALPVNVYELTAHSSSNVVVNDNMILVQKLLIDSPNITINGNITIPGLFPTNPITGLVFPGAPLLTWSAANAPNVENFTNNGSIAIPYEGHFGDDRPPYLSFVNTGIITVSGLWFNSDHVENSGQLIAVNALFANGLSGKFENGSTVSGNLASYTFNELKLNQHQIVAGGSIVFNVTDVFSDAGPASASLISAQDGFHLLTKPAMGDLLGTTLESFAPFVPSVRLNHSWAAEDRGATSFGYVNNAAVGVLALTTASPNPLFVFSGVNGQNALYADLLDLSSLSDYTNQLVIDQNLVIYYAAANLSFVPPGSLTPEEFLDGQFGGRLRWVRTFAGSHSSAPVLIGTQTFQVNAALFNSRFIDSDGDGTPNFFDTTPFSSVPVDPPGSFVPPFTPSAGQYSGLFHETNGVQFASSGAFSATTTKKGAYSAVLRMGNKRYAFSGKLNTNGAAVKSVSRKGSSPLTIHLKMDTAGNKLLAGSVSDGTWTSALQADRRIATGRANPAPFAGRYTLLLPGNGAADAPPGDGFGAIKVNSAGRIKLSGTLADGTKLSHGVSVSASGRWPVYSPLYKKKGQILGWLTFTNAGTEDLTGWANWIKPAVSGATYYPAGFNLTLPATGSTYNSSADPVFGFSSGILTLIDGNLSGGVTTSVAISPDNQVTGGNNLNIRLVESQGLFRGTIVDPLTSRTITFNGAILQTQGTGAGYFLGSSQGGRITISP